MLRRPKQKSKVTRWAILVALYVLWNIVMYQVHRLIFTKGLSVVYYDYIYWIGERVFVVASFWTLWLYVEKKYKWIIGALFWVAMVKLTYLMLVIFQVIKANDFHSLMAVLFTVVISVIVLKWEK